MKKSRIISACFFLFLFMVSCKSPQKLYEKGDYDGSIRVAVDRLRKKNVEEDDVKTLVEAFNYINSREADKLTRLRAEQRTDEKCIRRGFDGIDAVGRAHFDQRARAGVKIEEQQHPVRARRDGDGFARASQKVNALRIEAQARGRLNGPGNGRQGGGGGEPR